MSSGQHLIVVVLLTFGPQFAVELSFPFETARICELLPLQQIAWAGVKAGRAGTSEGKGKIWSVCARSWLQANSCLKDMLPDWVCTRPGLNLNPAKRLGWKSLVVHCVPLCMSTMCVDAWKMSVFVGSGERETMVICLCVRQYWVVNYSKVLSLKLKVFGRGI